MYNRLILSIVKALSTMKNERLLRLIAVGEQKIDTTGFNKNLKKRNCVFRLKI